MMIPMTPQDRLSYSAISQRPRLELPGGARLAVWIIVNIEEWDIHATMPRTVLTPPAGGSPVPKPPRGRHGQHASFGVLHRQAVLAGLVERAAGIGGASVVRDAAARSHEPCAAPLAAVGDRKVLETAVHASPREVGDEPARPLPAAAFRLAGL